MLTASEAAVGNHFGMSTEGKQGKFTRGEGSNGCTRGRLAAALHRRGLHGGVKEHTAAGAVCQNARNLAVKLNLFARRVRALVAVPYGHHRVDDEVEGREVLAGR